MAKYLTILFMVSLAGCTYSVNLVHTRGMASDIIDENQTAEPEVSLPAVNV